MPTETQLTANIPVNAFRSPRQALTLSKPTKLADAGTTDEPALPRGNFKMLARTGDPIYHWWWGWIVHDMAGFTAKQEVICVDYCHDCEEIIGRGDNQTASDSGLEISGELIAFRPDDRAAEVLFRSGEGIPYQSSIAFDYSRVEYLENQATTDVNGKTVVGPMYIVRAWTIEGVAVCPYGADSGTSTETDFAQTPNDGQSLHQRAVTLFSNGGTPVMPNDKIAPILSQEPTKLSAETPPNANDIAAGIRAELTKFTTKFGAENGAKWFGEGKTYVEALELHADALAAKNAETATKLAAEAEKLKSIGRGEAAPATATDFERPGGQAKPAKNAHLGAAFAKFSSGVKLPGQA